MNQHFITSMRNKHFQHITNYIPSLVRKILFGYDLLINFFLIAEILLYYSTIDEMTFYTHPIRTNDMKAYFNTTSEDLEFKKLIWSGILTSLQSNQLKVVDTVKNVKH